MSETPRRTDAVPPRLRARQSAAATSLERDDAELALEGRDLLHQGGGRDAQPLSRLREAPELRRGHDRVETSVVHLAPLSSVNQWFIPYQNIGNSQAAGAALAFDSHIGANRRDGNE